jgi:putative ATP-dependent endonuclease of OLD family
MKIEKINITNYRLLKGFSMDLEDELSLVVGKNNTGKTSLLTVMNKFLNGTDKTKFSLDDFNIDLKTQIKVLAEGVVTERDGFAPIGIEMKLIIKYDDNDNLANLGRIMMDLDPDHYYILLGFGFTMDYDSLIELRADFATFQGREQEKKAENVNYQVKDFFRFLKNNLNYFKPSRKSISCSKENGMEDGVSHIDLDKENISLKNIINFQYISAKRDVTNKELNKTLSVQTSKIYEKSEATDDQNEQVAIFKDTLGDTDIELSNIYKDLFKETIDKVSKFGGITVGESEVSIESTLQHRDLLKDNTTVMYTHGEHTFPEYNNGLGYMNLISIIFEMEILMQEFKRTKNEVPADINFLFIEEPEAHTHPQMQYVFINNIKELLKEGIKREDGNNKDLQYIVSTHSSHIVSESDFNDIRYLIKDGEYSVIAKGLKLLEAEYKDAGEEKNYRFLKQYLTLNKAELFFADKAIMVEGDTERILLPSMMKKVDQEQNENLLLSQNISLVEVGAHSQIFEKFIDFIGIKTLIITDIDAAKVISEDGITKRKACQVADANASVSTNASLKFFTGTDVLNDLKAKRVEQKRFKKEKQDDGTKKWVLDNVGHVQLAFQTEEENSEGDTYHARSFEDAFAHVNNEFLKDPENSFNSLTKTHFEKFKNGVYNPYQFAEMAMGKKPPFAIEILLNSTEDEDENQFSNWNIPAYIKEGLTWLKEN